MQFTVEEKKSQLLEKVLEIVTSLPGLSRFHASEDKEWPWKH